MIGNENGFMAAPMFWGISLVERAKISPDQRMMKDESSFSWFLLKRKYKRL